MTFLFKGPAADATEAPQPWGLLCNPAMKMISFLWFSILMEHRWNEIARGKTEVLEEEPVPVPLRPPQIPHGRPGWNLGLRGERQTTNRLSHCTAEHLHYTRFVKSRRR
jgi:hypothetical protein